MMTKSFTMINKTAREIKSQLAAHSLKSFFELLILNLKVHTRNGIEWLKVIYKYYRNPAFLKIDCYLLLSYLFKNPFRMNKRFLIAKGMEDVYSYGETPLTTMDFIAKECLIQKNDTVVELGSGRGRTCFWLNTFIGCKVIGIEWLPKFVKLANEVKKRCHVEAVEFHVQDMKEADLTNATIVYLYGTCLEDSFISNLVKKFKHLPKGTKVITVSYSLTEYGGGKDFEVMKLFPASFTWGEGDVYLQIRK